VFLTPPRSFPADPDAELADQTRYVLAALRLPAQLALEAPGA
jgi:hypothetical protein